MAPHALGCLIPEEAAVALQSKLNDLGVSWHFNTTVQSIDRNGNQLNITLANGSVLNTDVVLSAVGLRPRLKLVKAVGIATNIGIQVNRKLEANISHIYAIGDCAEVKAQSVNGKSILLKMGWRHALNPPMASLSDLF